MNYPEECSVIVLKEVRSGYKVVFSVHNTQHLSLSGGFSSRTSSDVFNGTALTKSRSLAQFMMQRLLSYLERVWGREPTMVSYY